MRVLLCGYHEAGCRALRTLASGGHEVLVATHPTPDGIPSVADRAGELSTPYVDGSPGEVFNAAREFAPDIIFSVYYRTILPRKVLELAPRGGFNFHPSLLPRHAGCFSGVWAILEGDRETGVTCHRMVERVDSGEIVDVVTLPIEQSDTGELLYYKLVDTAHALFERVLKRAECGPLRGRPQAGERSYHGREVPFDGIIDPEWSRDRIERFIRGLYFPPYEPACVELDGRHYAVRTIEDYDRLLQGNRSECEQREEQRVPVVQR